MIRTGIGYDRHRLVAGRRLVLGGVELESELGLEGHSDADVVTHAVIDALLGAAALGDIGQHFPDTDERYRDASSIELLRQTAQNVVARGYRIENVDTTIMLERPRVSTARDEIRSTLAEALGVPAESVSVKATRGEGMGFVGREEGAAALAVATVTAP
jgi:2-C-methyl-D-erythritol 2,4-cyclodiphosphate synthase